MNSLRTQGFTLIEVLLALAILAIALTALTRANGVSIFETQQLQKKNYEHLVAMQAVARIQLRLIHLAINQEQTEKMQLLGVQWYWRARIEPSGLAQVDRIIISTSTHPNGPFHEALLAFRIAS